ncbi:MAG TPA: hypothetical protein PLF40_18720 [Kofleriaceae bacterium]|nr:hypothetical protein [Kofleriaceae bacterium]
MDQRYKKKPKKSQIFGDVLSDFLSNTDDLLVVSARVRTTFEQAGHSGIEFLPAKITNWQDELVSEPYWIVNFLNPLDCLDVGASKTPDTATRARYEANGLALPAPGTQWWQLVIDQKRIDPTLQIFQIAGTRLTCVRDDFWEKLREYPNLEQVENASDVIVDI